MDEETIIRFCSKIKKNEENGCWEWQGTIQNKGYGQFWYDYKMQLAHRIAYRMYTGKIFFNSLMHTCDNPRCVNPRHLKEGSQSDNIMDMFRKGRQGDCRHFGSHSCKHNCYGHQR